MKEYVRLGILHTSAKCDFPIAGIKCHNQGNKWKEVFIGLMISKRDSVTIGGTHGSRQLEKEAKRSLLTTE